MFLFIKAYSWPLSGQNKYRLSPNLHQWYVYLIIIFFSNYFQCMKNVNDAFWLYCFALARCPPGILHFIRKFITIWSILTLPPGPFLTHRQRRIGEIVNVYVICTCKQPIFIYWNYRWDYQIADRYRSWNSACKMAVIARMDELFRGICKNVHLL